WRSAWRRIARIGSSSTVGSSPWVARQENGPSRRSNSYAPSVPILQAGEANRGDVASLPRLPTDRKGGVRAKRDQATCRKSITGATGERNTRLILQIPIGTGRETKGVNPLTSTSPKGPGSIANVDRSPRPSQAIHLRRARDAHRADGRDDDPADADGHVSRDQHPGRRGHLELQRTPAHGDGRADHVDLRA